jgi:hypothetical protein
MTHMLSVLTFKFGNPGALFVSSKAKQSSASYGMLKHHCHLRQLFGVHPRFQTARPEVAGMMLRSLSARL